MASLQIIIGSILKDIIAAQHAANKYSLALSADYGSCGKLKSFQLPNALIGSLSLNVPYAIKNISSKIPKKIINLNRLHRKYREFAELFAESIVLGLMESLKNSEEVGRSKKFLEVYSSTISDPKTKEQFCEFLIVKIVNLLKEQTDFLLDKEKGTLQEAHILEALEDLAKTEISGHDELTTHFKETSWEAFLLQALKAIRSGLSCHASKLSHINFFVRTPETVIDILSTITELKDMPPESLHSLRLDISPRQYSCIKGADNEDQFVPGIDSTHTS